MHVALGSLGRKCVEHLRIARRAQRGEAQDLRLSAREQAGAMGARAQPGFDADRTNLAQAAPVWPAGMIDNLTPHFGF